MPLDLAHEGRLVLACAVGQGEDRVTPGAMNQLFEIMRVHSEVLGHDAVPVEHRRDLARGAKRLCAGRAELGTLLDGQRELFSSHGFLYKRRP